MSKIGTSQNKDPKIVVTDTILVGIKFNCGVMIATDLLPTIGAHTSNIHRLHDNIYAAVTGVAQDTCILLNVIRSKLEMHHMTTNYRRVPVRCANQMIKQLLHNQAGSLNVNLLIAGVDKYGSTIYSTRFDGSSDTVPFTAIGSGMLGALSVLETRWSINLDRATARDVIYESVVYGMRQPVDSNCPVRLCILSNDYSVVHETMGSVVQLPKVLVPIISQIVPKILHERVEKVESKTPRKADHFATEERGQENGEGREESKGRGQEKIDD